MKRCPKCNQTFAEEWLSFCTQDGTSLIDTTALPSEPPATMMSPGPPLPPSVSPSEQPTVNLPGSYSAPSTQPNQPPQYSPPPFSQPQPMQGSWQPPPPPSYVQPMQQGLAIASLICGIFSVTIGWCCYTGVVTGPIAIGLGIVALVQIKNDPKKFGGKPLAIAGIATGSAYFVIIAFIILIYGFALLAGGMR